MGSFHRHRSLSTATAGSGWALAGLGHCGGSGGESWELQRLETNLRRCLQRCQELARCSHVSFLDTTVVREGSRGLTWGLCWIYAACPKLLSTLPGFATFRRQRRNDDARKEQAEQAEQAAPRSSSAGSQWGAAVAEATAQTPHVQVTLALSPSLAESLQDRFEHRQLCVAPGGGAGAGGAGARPRLLAKAPGCGLGLEEEEHALFEVRRVEVEGVSGASRASRASRVQVGPHELVSVFVEISWKGYKLCAEGEEISLSRCDGPLHSSLWELQRAGEGHESLPSEPCLWLRSAEAEAQQDERSELGGRYLALQDSRLQLRSRGSGGCWHLGQKQTWTEQHFQAAEEPEEAYWSFGPTDMTEKTPVVWLMASKSYRFLLERLKLSFRQAGEAVRVQVRWVPDMKDTKLEGFKLMGSLSPSYKVFYFNYAKYLFLFEALLEAETAFSETPLLVVMDLDVQVFPGWTSTLRRCLADDGLTQSEEEEEGTPGTPAAALPKGAEVCFLQQAAFGDGRLQQANSGVLVFGGTKTKKESQRSSLGSFGALLGALVSRLQSQEIFAQLLPNGEPVAFEQLHLNYVLNFIRKRAEAAERGGGKMSLVRWGIYSPLVAYAGMFLTHAILTDTVHHATASNVNLKEKLRFLEAAKLMSEDFRQLCPLNFEGKLSQSGPLEEFCFYFTAKDPHFGPLLPHHKLFQGFSETDNEVVLNHLMERAKGRKAWIQLIIHFNERAYKRWCKARQNTSETLRKLLELQY
ncbi:DD3-3 [Symbiodinium sp. CCMP2456]|nr:DD3-3 [Symbiodinium sp. CCMP2456]